MQKWPVVVSLTAIMGWVLKAKGNGLNQIGDRREVRAYKLVAIASWAEV